MLKVLRIVLMLATLMLMLHIRYQNKYYASIKKRNHYASVKNRYAYT